MSRMLPQSVLVLLRLALLLLTVAPALVGATAVRSETPLDGSPWLQAISSSFLISDMTEGDVDGDGHNEVVICYQDSPDNPTSAGGVAVLQKRKGVLVPVFHVRLDHTWCEQVKIKGRQIGMLLRSNTLDKKHGELVWTYGKELHWIGSAGHPLAGARAEASSRLGASADAVLDGDLETTWAEGIEGTGIGEKITIKLPRPMDIAYVGIWGAQGTDPRTYLESNRLYRGSIEVRTAADLGDEVAGIDFSELGINVGGDRREFALENYPHLTYIRIDRKDVSELELRIDSVYLGRSRDDTHVAVIELVPRLNLRETLDRARELSATRPPARKPAAAPADDDEEEEEEGSLPKSSDADAALHRLDGVGRGLDLAKDDM
jgi:hypothetical protein